MTVKTFLCDKHPRCFANNFCLDFLDVNNIYNENSFIKKTQKNMDIINGSF